MTATVLQCDREALKPCPFCGDRRTHIMNGTNQASDGSWSKVVWCLHCQAHSPEKASEAEAIAAWNTRPVSSEIWKGRPSMTNQTGSLYEKLCALQSEATPGPYRAHDHSDMSDPDKWNGYGWIGRVTANSTPDGRFDAAWLETDRRADRDAGYRERAPADVHFVAEVLNALPELLAALKEREDRPAQKIKVCDRDWAIHFAQVLGVPDLHGDRNQETLAELLSEHRQNGNLRQPMRGSDDV